MAVSTTRLGEFPIMISGSRRETHDCYEVRSPYDAAPVAVVHRAQPSDIEEAIAGAVSAFEETRHLASWQRESVLRAISEGIAARREELAETIALEAGKPLNTARTEV